MAAGGLATPETGKLKLSIRSTPVAVPTAVGANVTVKLNVSPAAIVAGSGGACDIEKTGVADGSRGGDPAGCVTFTLMLFTAPAAVPLLVIWKTRLEVCPTELGGKITPPLFWSVVVMPPATNE